MRSLAAVAARMTRPLSAAADVPDWIQMVGSATALVAGGSIAGIAISPAVGIGVVLAVLLALAISTAFNLQRELERQESDRPHLVVAEPKTRAAFEYRKDTFKGFSVDLPVANHPQPHAEMGVAAEHVHARLRVVPDETGTPASEWMEALWLERQQAGNRFVGAVDENAKPEVELPPNGRPLNLATVMQLDGNEFCTIVTQADYWDIGVTWPFTVEIEVQGSNFPKQTHRLRVTPSADKLGPPEAELIDVS